MPTSVYVENPDDATKRLKPNLDGSANVTVLNPTTSVSVSNLPATQPVSGTVAVSNLPATQPVSGSVSVSNFPATQVVSGTVSVNPSAPASGDIVRASLSATGTLYSVPSGRTFYGSVSLSGCVALAGSSQPAISTGGVDIHRITINGLALVSVASANTISDVYVAGPAAITFTAGATGTSTGQIAGRLL